MHQNTFFLRTRDLQVSQKTTQRHFFPTLHPLSLVIFATASVVAFVLLCNSRFNFHCYTQREATPTQKLARKWRCNLLRLVAWKITKGIHSCKPASLNRPIGCPKTHFFYKLTIFWSAKTTTQRCFFIYPPSPFHGNFYNCNRIGMCTASRF